MAGEKYGDLVRVVKAGPSVEFCGGTHAHATGELGLFVILSESSIGSGVRRIEAVVSKAAEAYVARQSETIAQLSDSLSAKPDELVERVGRLQSDVRDLQKGLAEIKARMASADAAAYVERAERVNGTTLVGAVVREANAEALRSLASAIRSRFPSGVIALVGTDGESVSLIASASDDAITSGVNAGHLIKAAAPLVGGKGGGAAAQAQGGGKNPAGAEAALAAMRAAVSGHA
jgi:alanyl-tRNA synthetase